MKTLVWVLFLATAATVFAAKKVPPQKYLKPKVASMKSAPGDNPAKEAVSARLKRAACEIKPTQASASERAIYVEEHNMYRAKVGASNMYRMEWDDSLAQRAQAWADRCVWKHGFKNDCSGNGMGQNLYMVGGGNSFPANNPRASIKSWYDEISFYDYGNNKCAGGVCGHYTQVAWSSSTKVGCGYARCPIMTLEGQDPWTNVLYTVCNYSPAGNYQGVRPYFTGTPCSGCTSSDSGIDCTSKLCKKCNRATDRNCVCKNPCGANGSNDPQTCKCNCKSGYFGPQCQNSCSDCQDAAGASTCASWSVYCSDSSYRDFMTSNCKKSCGFCPGC